jgi:hypothetical protein
MQNLPGSLKLNAFQTLVRRWEAVHPQNAAQVMCLDAPLDAEACEYMWQSLLQDVGLGSVSTSGSFYWHEVWDGQPPAPLVAVPTVGLEAHLQAEINRRFAGNGDPPYRPFVLEQGGHSYLGIVYQQWVADSASVRLLMREWFLRIHDATKARRKLFTLIGGARGQGPRLGASPLRLLRVGLEILRWARQSRKLRRPLLQETATPSPAIQLRIHTMPESQIASLLAYSRAEGMTVNDLLLAAFAAALDRLCPADGRGGLALATSMDLRPYTPADLSEAFGSLLTYPTVICPADKLSDIRQLALHIARQNHALKDLRALAIRTAMMRLLAWFASRAAPTDVRLYRRLAPIMGAATNVNMSRAWPVAYHPHPIRSYLRFSPPAPTVPASLSATTLGNSFNLTLCSQPGMLTDEQAAAVLSEVASILASLTV